MSYAVEVNCWKRAIKRIFRFVWTMSARGRAIKYNSVIKSNSMIQHVAAGVKFKFLHYIPSTA